MELLTGRELRRRAAELAWRRACTLAPDIASSLAVMHSRRLVHRDVTLRNILYDARTGALQAARLRGRDELRCGGPVIGTPPYLPPQVFEERPLEVAPICSRSALAYHVLTGGHAYPAQRTQELPARGRSGRRRPTRWARAYRAR